MVSAAEKPMTIGELARRASLNVETIRFYERNGIIAQPSRPAAGYRAYPPAVVARLGFVHEAKQLGFTLKEIRDLLTLRENPQTDAAAVRARAAAKLAQIEDRISQFQRMRATLQELLFACPGSGALDQCSIVEALSASQGKPVALRIGGKRRTSMRTVDLTIKGMHCEGCAKTVEALLSAESGVKAAAVAFASSGARVLFDPDSIDLPRLIETVERAGFEVVGEPV